MKKLTKQVKLKKNSGCIDYDDNYAGLEDMV